MTPAQLDELERLHAAATEAPWFAVDTGYGTPHEDWALAAGDGGATVSRHKDFEGWETDGGSCGYVIGSSDAALISAMRNALPELLKAARELERDDAGKQCADCERELNAAYNENAALESERDNLLRLVGRLQTGNDIESDYIDALKLARDERDALKAETLRADIAEIVSDALEAEVATHRETVARLQDRRRDADEEIARLKAEVERLRDMLETDVTGNDLYFGALEREHALGVEVEQLRAQLATEVAVNADYPDVVQRMDEALAEVELMRNQRDQYSAHVDVAYERCEVLQAEVERLDPEWVCHHTASEISIATQQLRSENERLRAERDEHRDTLVKCASRERHLDSLRKKAVRESKAENDRLRAALRLIAYKTNVNTDVYGIAKDALEEPK